MTQEPNHIQDQDRLILLVQRRTDKLKANQIKAEEYAQSGDELVAAGSFLQASYFYADAVRLWTTRVEFHVKLATAYVQAKQFEQAALTATRALSMNPKHIEARYQRGLARLEQGLLKAAQVDFETVLTHHPSHTPSLHALAQVQSIFSSLNKAAHTTTTQHGSTTSTSTPIVSDSSSPDLDYTFPGYDEVGLELVDISDSEECGHLGNGVPCRFYNRKGSGCGRGLGCNFMHAPDEKSVRDTLGRNVCLYHLLGSCKFGDAKCVYSHEKEWLPESGWWNDNAQIERMKKLVEMAGRDAKEQRELLAKLKGPQGSSGGNTRNRKKGHRFTRQKRGRSKFSPPPMWTMPPPPPGGPSDSDEDDDDDDDELLERMANFGFSAAEMEDLMCQGVKPWDDDAWDVMHALNSM